VPSFSLCCAECAETLISRIPADPAFTGGESIPSHDRDPDHHFNPLALHSSLHLQQHTSSTLNSGAEYEHVQSCRPSPAWCIGIASSRGMSKASRLPSNGPPRLWMRSLLAALKHNSSPYSYEIPPSNLSTSSHVSARVSHAGTALPAVPSRQPFDTFPQVLAPDPSSIVPPYRNRESAPRSPNPLDVIPSHLRSDRA
jgi:hypothetical protein